MREIKFRAWVTNGNGVTYSNGNHMEYDVVIVGGKYASVESGWDIQGTYDYPLMQFTGLKDKNGKEIYEGDVVTIVYSDTPNGFKKLGGDSKYIDVYAEVCFHNGKWALKHKEPIDQEIVYGDLFQIMQNNPKEVIGSVYENPELLGGNK